MFTFTIQSYDLIINFQVEVEQIHLDLSDIGATEADVAKRVKIFTNAYECAAGVDAIVIATEWDEFKTLDYERIYENMNKPAFIFDGRLILDMKKLASIGFSVETIGKPPVALSGPGVSV